MTVSDIFDATQWNDVPQFHFTDITYHRAKAHGTVRIAFNRPEVRNAFRPHTVDELFTALDHARQSSDVGCVLLTGNGPSPKDGGWAFCSGGDQRIRGKDGYQYVEGNDIADRDPARMGRLHILEVFLGREYSADDAHRMGMVNAVVPHSELESTALQWAKEVNEKSPTAQRMLKFSFNLIDDGLVGQQIFAGEATRLAYMTDEAQEGRDSFLEKRDADWSRFPWYY